MALTIQERLKSLRVERGLTLEQLGAHTHLSESALSNFKEISHSVLFKRTKFCNVTAGYLLGLMATKNHPNQ